MMAILLMAAAAAAQTPLPSPTPARQPGTARSVMESQLAMPPRTGADAGLNADEADMIQKRYLASIGQGLDLSAGESPR